jgi:metal-responsive CopG/Arc/MetJ family transcriptional regulator
MRTTLTLDEDVAQALQRLRRERRARLKDLINEALRRGLAEFSAAETREKRAGYRIQPADAAPRRPNVDDVAGTLDAVDGDGRR